MKREDEKQLFYGLILVWRWGFTYG